MKASFSLRPWLLQSAPLTTLSSVSHSSLTPTSLHDHLCSHSSLRIIVISSERLPWTAISKVVYLEHQWKSDISNMFIGWLLSFISSKVNVLGSRKGERSLRRSSRGDWTWLRSGLRQTVPGGHWRAERASPEEAACSLTEAWERLLCGGHSAWLEHRAVRRECWRGTEKRSAGTVGGFSRWETFSSSAAVEHAQDDHEAERPILRDCVSQFVTAVTNTWGKHLKGGKICLDSWVQRLQALVSRFCC
jgi:hypothetical protein